MTLENLTWMDNMTREKALNKFDKMESVVAYPSELLDNSKINQYYEGSKTF